ncbi:pickpocket protein 28-like [Bacillus rossius redtenbacheri]|uniref:pickpocket protein 28-like n=1 Tax=Bacillus rossius redtenbacheri TaxID=93214 RepID=UPI002FDD119C
MESAKVFRIKLTPQETTVMSDSIRPRHNSTAWTAVYNMNQEKNSARGFTYQDSLAKDRGGVGKASATPSIASKTQPQLRSIFNKVNWVNTVWDYCQNSSLHGLRYVGDKQLNITERVFWSVAFVLAVLSAGYYINMLYTKWVSNPVIVSVGATRTNLVDIPFPAITVCNMNKAKKSVAETILQQPWDSPERQLLNDLCDMEEEMEEEKQPGSKPQNITIDWETVKKFMVKVSQSCSEMFKLCSYAGQTRNCEELFNTALTDDGLCCVFNQVNRKQLFRNPLDLSDLNVTAQGKPSRWTPDGGYPPETPVGSVPYRPRGAGAHLGLTVVLDVQDHEYFCSSSSSIGFKMMVHNPAENPKMNMFAFLVEPGKESRIVVRPTISGALPELRLMAPENRACAFSDEQHLKYYKTYTQRNCALECEANFTLEQCQCVSYYMPKSAKTPICGTWKEACADNARKIMEIHLEDKNANTSDIFLEHENKPRCNCIPGCNELGYSTYLTSSQIYKPNKLLVTDPNNQLSIINSAKQLQFFFRENIAIVHLYFMESHFLNFQKGELFGFIDFLSSTGGLLGLFMGFSFLSAVEVAYYLLLRVTCLLTAGPPRVANQSSLPLVRGGDQPRPLYPFSK